MLSEKQAKILAFQFTDYDALICSGAVRSGKTSIGVLSFIDWGMSNFNGRKFAICGNTVKSAIENIIVPYTSMQYAQEHYRLKFSQYNNILTVESNKATNVFEVFGGKDEASYKLIQGRTLAGVYFDEVALMPQSFVNQATARCSVDGSRFWFNCNPESPRHWFYTDWILNAKEKNACVLEFEIRDNPSLSERVIQRYESMYHGVFYDRYILGKWVVAEGLVYQFDDASEYTVTHDEALGDKRGMWYLSIDYGITNPFAALLWRVTPDCAYIVDEYYFASRETGRRRTDSEHYDAVAKFASDHNIDAIVIDPSATSFKEEIYRRGKYDVSNARNDVLEGIQVTDQMLHNGYVKISDTCTETLKEMQLYRWDDKAAKDEVVKENDHAMDAMRYFANTKAKYLLRGWS